MIINPTNEYILKLANLELLERKKELVKQYEKDKDILKWGELLFSDKFTLPFCEKLHSYMVQTRIAEFLGLEAPRNHAKTLIKCFLIEIFQAIVEPYLYNHYLNVQSTGDKALAINRTLKTEFENNDLLISVYGDMVGERWTDQQFVLTNGVVFSAVGAGQSIRGINYNSRRPDYIVADDLYDEEDIENVQSTEKKTKWFWGSLYPTRARSKRTAIHVQGTAINTYDLLESLKTRKRWLFKSFQAIEDMDSKTVLWPELNTFDSLMDDLEDQGSIIFDREMQNQRRNDKESIVKKSWLYRIDGSSWEYDPVQLSKRLAEGEIFITGILVGNDPSIGKTKQADSTGTALVIETEYADGDGGTEYWIEDLWNEKLTMLERIKQLVDIEKSKPRGKRLTEVRIEAISAFDDYASEVIRKTNLPVTKISWVKDKITVLVNKSKFFENGKVHLNMNIDSKLKKLIVTQLTTNVPKHDDLRDSVLLTLPDDSVVEPSVTLI